MSGIAAMIVSVIAYLAWLWWQFRGAPGFISIDVRSLLSWPVLLGVFLAAFILEYRHASKRG